MERYEMKQRAKAVLEGKWGMVIAITILAMILNNINFTNSAPIFRFNLFAGDWGDQFRHMVTVRPQSSTFTSLINFLLAGPVAFGVANFYLVMTRTAKTEFDSFIQGFKRFLDTLVAHFLMAVFTILWSLLLVIPGIIAALSYAMTYYIMIDNPEVSPSEAIQLSKEMMNGHKAELFILGLSFLGWLILGALTFGLGLLYAVPYINATMVQFYQSISGNQEHHYGVID